MPPAEVYGTDSVNGAAPAEVESGKSRRALLEGLGVAAAGAVVGGVVSPEDAQAQGNFHQVSNNQNPAIHGNNTAGGPGVQGDSADSAGRRGDGVVGVEGFGSGIEDPVVSESSVQVHDKSLFVRHWRFLWRGRFLGLQTRGG